MHNSLSKLSVMSEARHEVRESEIASAELRKTLTACPWSAVGRTLPVSTDGYRGLLFSIYSLDPAYAYQLAMKLSEIVTLLATKKNRMYIGVRPRYILGTFPHFSRLARQTICN